MEQFHFNVEVHPDAREVKSLSDRIDTFNVEETKIYDFKELAIVLRDSTRQLVAGIYAFTWGGCLDIRSLWVREDHRQAGIGSKLMHAAEQEAIRRGCRIATLETHSFQAPAFYEKLGYEEIGVLDGYPTGHKKHYLKKVLSPKPGCHQFNKRRGMRATFLGSSTPGGRARRGRRDSPCLDCQSAWLLPVA